MLDHAKYITQTKQWLSSVVIAHTLCPFAKREYDNDTIHYAVIEAMNSDTQLEQIILHCAALDDNAGVETSLLILPQGLSDFDAYLVMLGIAEDLLEIQGYTGIYQLASFHPQYRFACADADDPSHYTNRSPYPMVQILREASVEAALKRYPNPENIPDRNIALTRTLGLKTMTALLDDCFK